MGLDSILLSKPKFCFCIMQILEQNGWVRALSSFHPPSLRYSCERSPRPFHGLFERPMENLLLIMTIWIQGHFYMIPTKSLYGFAGQFVSAAFYLIFPHLHNALSFCSASPYTCWSLCEHNKFFFHNLKAFAILARLPFHWIRKCSST